MMIASQTCGCYFARVEDPESKGHMSMTCPLHSSASEFLETIRWMANTIHQAYHQDELGTFIECARDTCCAARQAIEKVRPKISMSKQTADFLLPIELRHHVEGYDQP